MGARSFFRGAVSVFSDVFHEWNRATAQCSTGRERLWALRRIRLGANQYWNSDMRAAIMPWNRRQTSFAGRWGFNTSALLWEEAHARIALRSQLLVAGRDRS